MFFKTPDKSDLAHSNKTARWTSTYSMLVGTALYPATVNVLYVAPSYELLDLYVEVDPELKEHRMFDYANQIVTQQGVAEYMEWADKKRKTTPIKSEDPLFER
jgi:hypothetical protein